MYKVCFHDWLTLTKHNKLRTETNAPYGQGNINDWRRKIKIGSWQLKLQFWKQSTLTISTRLDIKPKAKYIKYF